MTWEVDESGEAKNSTFDQSVPPEEGSSDEEPSTPKGEPHIERLEDENCDQQEEPDPPRARKPRKLAEELVSTSQTCEEFLGRLPTEWRVRSRSGWLSFESFVRNQRLSYMRTVGGVTETVPVRTPRQYYALLKHRQHVDSGRNTFDAETDRKLHTLIHKGISPEAAVKILRRSLSYRGGRFLAASVLERDVVPHLSDPLTARQADLLVKLAQSAFDEAEMMWMIRAK